MQQSAETLYFAGLFLRFGVPLGLTIFLAWLLKNIDMQWLEEAKGKRAVEKTQTPSEIHGCWIHHDLSQDNTHNQDLQGACWKVRVKFEGILPDACLECKFLKQRFLEKVA